jgi:hypothetical protein
VSGGGGGDGGSGDGGGNAIAHTSAIPCTSTQGRSERDRSCLNERRAHRALHDCRDMLSRELSSTWIFLTVLHVHNCASSICAAVYVPEYTPSRQKALPGSGSKPALTPKPPSSCMTQHGVDTQECNLNVQSFHGLNHCNRTHQLHCLRAGAPAMCQILPPTRNHARLPECF